MTNSITTINGTQIVTVDEAGDIFVPIKPICTALGISDQSQRKNIAEDELLSSVGTLRVSTGADGKQYEMFCLPLKFIYGWLFSINPKNVAPEARENVSRFRRECYEALYDHFSASIKRTIEFNKTEIELLEKINEARIEEKEARTRRQEIESKLEKIRKSRLNPQPALF